MVMLPHFRFLFLSLPLFASTSLSHLSEHTFEDHHALANRFAHGTLDNRVAEPMFDSTDDSVNLHYKKLTKKSLYNLAGNNPADESILGQAFLDLQALVTYVSANPNAQALARYFDPNDANDVTAVFTTVMQMASVNPPRNPPGARANLQPTDLHNISVVRASGGIPDLAESFNVGINALNQQIKVYNFGWSALWQRLRSSIKCSDIGPKTNYKMHFLGSLLLHETLHFNNVGILARNQILAPNEILDDQPGNFPCLSKAYGPYEAIQLRGRSTAMAKANIENYVWYALETYWNNQCPGAAPGGMFTAPKGNDIPNVCKQGAKGGLANIWCWVS